MSDNPDWSRQTWKLSVSCPKGHTVLVKADDILPPDKDGGLNCYHARCTCGRIIRFKKSSLPEDVKEYARIMHR